MAEKKSITEPKQWKPDASDLSVGSEDQDAIRIHNNVIGSIAREAALSVAGVAELSSSLADGLAGMIGKRSGDRGIRVETSEAGLTIELHIVVEYGVRIQHVAWQVQSEVRKAVEQMTGKAVLQVQIAVEGLKIPEKTVHKVDQEESVS